MNRDQTWQDAVSLALQAEDEAARFYDSAAANACDGRGCDMFRQLAEFERSHYRHLQRLLAAQSEADIAPYLGTAWRAYTPGAPALAAGADRVRNDLEVLAIAIKAEQNARRAYLDLAEHSTGAVREMFLKIADEEELHRRVLEDQHYALTNRGVWVWGD